MTKYLTAKQLGILPEERRALIAFVEAPALGRIVSVNGQAHYYDQSSVNDPFAARDHDCGTAGCVAGFVFAHARHVQKLRKLRGGGSAQDYIEAATEERDVLHEDGSTDERPVVPLLYDLYCEGDTYKLTEAKKVVSKMLKTGKVAWPET